MSSKRIRKNEIKYRINLNEEQKAAKTGSYDKDVSIFLGDFGSGKTQTAVQIALNFLFTGEVEKIYVTRPIDFEATGFLKGSISEKMYFHTLPTRLCFYNTYDRDKIDKLFSEKIIEIVPIDYMKGMTFLNSVTIVDEFEDINYKDFKLILTRLGKGSKLIFTGSEEQIDIPDSCIPVIKKLENSDLVNFHTFKGQHRNEDIQKIIDFLEEKNG